MNPLMMSENKDTRCKYYANGRCPFFELGYNFNDCPYLKKGKYRNYSFNINLLNTNIFDSNFVSSYYHPYVYANPQYAEDMAVENMSISKTKEMWSNLTNLFAGIDKAYELFNNVETLFDRNANDFEKSLSAIDIVYGVSNRKTEKSQSLRTSIANMGIESASNLAMHFARKMDDYDRNKNIVIFGINVLTKAAKKVVGGILG